MITNFTIIIPHKNSIDLLLRCLKSIPEREDIQIIVIDDNSETADWEGFPYLKCPKFELIKTTEGRGAGYVRNIGINHAKGKWLVFADCDDYFEKAFLDILDKYKDSDVDVVYYGANSIDSETKVANNRTVLHNKYLQMAANDETFVEWVKYHLHSPWWKMVKRDFVIKHDIRFEEVPNGNDILWSFQIAYLAKKVIVLEDKLYNYTYTKGSITTRKNFIPKYLCRILHKIQTNRFFDYIGHSEWKKNVYRSLFAPLRREGVWMFLKTTAVLIINLRMIIRERNMFINVITSRP